MRALAHPTRLRLLRLLTERGPATATQLAPQAKASVASVAYHIGQLAKYGFVEDVPGATGRARPWRARSRGLRWSSGYGAPDEFVDASRLLRHHFVRHALESLEDYQEHEDEFDGRWREAAFVLGDMAMLSAGRLVQFNEELRQLISRYQDDDAAVGQQVDARSVRLFAFGVPDPQSTVPGTGKGRARA